MLKNVIVLGVDTIDILDRSSVESGRICVKSVEYGSESAVFAL